MAKRKIGIRSEQEWGTEQVSPAGLPGENGKVKVRYEFITGEVSEIDSANMKFPPGQFSCCGARGIEWARILLGYLSP